MLHEGLEFLGLAVGKHLLALEPHFEEVLVVEGEEGRFGDVANVHDGCYAEFELSSVAPIVAPGAVLQLQPLPAARDEKLLDALVVEVRALPVQPQVDLALEFLVLDVTVVKRPPLLGLGVQSRDLEVLVAEHLGLPEPIDAHHLECFGLLTEFDHDLLDGLQFFPEVDSDDVLVPAFLALPGEWPQVESGHTAQPSETPQGTGVHLLGGTLLDHGGVQLHLVVALRE